MDLYELYLCGGLTVLCGKSFNFGYFSQICFYTFHAFRLLTSAILYHFSDLGGGGGGGGGRR